MAELTDAQRKIIKDQLRAEHGLRLRSLTEEGFTPKQAEEIILKEEDAER
jgi:hypothetical protein